SQWGGQGRTAEDWQRDREEAARWAQEWADRYGSGQDGSGYDGSGYDGSGSGRGGRHGGGSGYPGYPGGGQRR
ncbi:hypothetical protein AB4Z54_50550, partial [Streptomyces sp. MCAF7]